MKEGGKPLPVRFESDEAKDRRTTFHPLPIGAYMCGESVHACIRRGTYALNSDDVSIMGENWQSLKINVFKFTRLMFIEKCILINNNLISVNIQEPHVP